MIEFAMMCQLLGSALRTFASIPQITQVRITKKTEGLNLGTYWMLLGGQLLSMVYGYHLVMTGMGATLLLTTFVGTIPIFTLLVMVITYRHKEEN